MHKIFNYMYKPRNIQFKTGITVLPYEVLKDFGTLQLPFCHHYNIFLVLKVQNYGIYGPSSMTKVGRKKGQWLYQLSKGVSQKLSQNTFTYIPLANDMVIPNCKGSCKCSYIVGCQFNFYYPVREKVDIGE